MNAFEIIGASDQNSPFVFASPHSGEGIPPSMMEKSRLSRDDLRRAEDCYVDELYQCAPSLGAPLLKALCSRTCVDLNRSAMELDPKMFMPVLKTRGLKVSEKVKVGLGVIPSIVAVGQPIYRAPLSHDECDWRMSQIYAPYHNALARLLETTRQTYGKAILIDCHSMPSVVPTYKKSRSLNTLKTGPDIVIGDRFGTTANASIVHQLVELFQQAGLSVAMNKPYAGGWCTRRYGNPANNYHAVQIEICRSLYMDERSFEKTNGFAKMQETLRAVMQRLVNDQTGLAQAAE